MKTDIGIHYTITILILFESWITANGIYNEELSNLLKKCQPKSSCENVNHTTADLDAINNDDGLGGIRRNCLCDDRCVVYGDCCIDYSHFNKSEQRSAAARYSCIPTNVISGAYVVNRCPATWTNTSVREACHATAKNVNNMLGNPVTSQKTGHAYKNRFCAVCNDDNADPILWNTEIVCKTIQNLREDKKEEVKNTLRYNEITGLFEVKLSKTTEICEQITVAPNTTRIRNCLPNAVATCDPQWPKDEIRSNCEAYTTVIYHEKLPYKNMHCAKCNNVNLDNLTCDSSTDMRNPNLNFHSFTMLLHATPDHNECCDPGTYYDPISKTCHYLLTSMADDGVPLNCSKRVMYPVSDKDWRPPNDKTNYVTLNNGSMILYADTNHTPNGETLSNVVLTYVGLGVSAVSLIVHLTVFAVLPEMKNLSGKNLASFCVSLLCSYMAFFVNNWLTGPACYVGAAFTYYAFITSFAWMLVMSFDCWFSLRLSTIRLRVTSGRQTKKFLVYSAVCWLVPAMMTFVAVVADSMPKVFKNFRPRFGESIQCWFGSNDALFLFFSGPLTIIMAVNIVLFGWTAYMIHSSRVNGQHVNTRHVRRDFYMYYRLGVLMGLTWSTGIVARYTHNDIMWIVFVLFNTFQGLFIFIAFTCRRHLLKLLVRSFSVRNDSRSRSTHETNLT